MSEGKPLETVPIRALVVDDDPMITALLSAFLQSQDYQLDVAADGREALDKLEAAEFNLVITDWNMPQMDGLALCRAIRARRTSAYVYCIMLTSSDDQQTLVAAMEAGVDDFVGKPLQPAELGARLRAAERVIALEAGLARRNQELATALGQLNAELQLARNLQLGQLPAPSSIGPLRFDWLFDASNFVGGDMFDYFSLDDRHVAFYVADVSGHGVAAAMMAFHSKHQLLASSQAVRAAQAPGDVGAMAVAIVTEYNRRVLEMGDNDLYLTLVYGLVDRISGHAALVHAGHPPTLHAGPGAAFEVIGKPGLPVGILLDPGYEATRVVLSPGSRLLLYSDGVTDCASASGEAFGSERLRREASGSGPLGIRCKAIGRALRLWRGGAFEDDVTALALEMH